MKAPITINDSTSAHIAGDVRVYATIELAESSLESHDAYDEQLHAIDSCGLLLKIVPIPGTGRAILEPAEAAPTHLEFLAQVLRQFLHGVGETADHIERLPASELLALVFQKAPNPYS